MTSWTPVLLAEMNFFYYLGDHFRPGRSQSNLQGAGIVAAVIAAVVLVVWVGSRWRAAQERRSKHDPWLLLSELCRAHRLSSFERRLTRRIASQARLAEPAMILLDPTILQAAAQKTGERRTRQTLLKLKERLFANPEAPASTPTPQRMRVD